MNYTPLVHFVVCEIPQVLLILWSVHVFKHSLFELVTSAHIHLLSQHIFGDVCSHFEYVLCFETRHECVVLFVDHEFCVNVVKLY